MPRDGMQLLSDYAGGKIAIICSCCLSRLYDVKKMLERTGDLGMPELLDRLALAEGCVKSRQVQPPKNRRECGLRLDLASVTRAYRPRCPIFMEKVSANPEQFGLACFRKHQRV